MQLFLIFHFTKGPTKGPPLIFFSLFSVEEKRKLFKNRSFALFEPEAGVDLGRCRLVNTSVQCNHCLLLWFMTRSSAYIQTAPAHLLLLLSLLGGSLSERGLDQPDDLGNEPAEQQSEQVRDDHIETALHRLHKHHAHVPEDGHPAVEQSEQGVAEGEGGVADDVAEVDVDQGRGQHRVEVAHGDHHGEVAAEATQLAQPQSVQLAVLSPHQQSHARHVQLHLLTHADQQNHHQQPHEALDLTT